MTRISVSIIGPVQANGLVGGSDKRKILDALADPIGETVLVSLEISRGVVTIGVPKRQDLKAYQVYVAAYLPQASTPVGRGENSGRTL